MTEVPQPRKKGAWHRKRVWPLHAIVGTLVCERCGKTYPAMGYQIRRKQRFCSGDCRYPPAEERFWAKVEKTDHCWNWKGSKVAKRYGGFKLDIYMLAHRVSWIWANGPIPDGLYVCHKCDNGFCVRPDHLFLGSQQDNMNDMKSKGRGNNRGRWRK